MANDKRRVLLTHYDLDGMGCDILLSSMFDITKKHHYGYGKIKSCIESGDLEKYDSVLVSDVSLTNDQFHTLYKKYGESFLYVDHHVQSLEMMEAYDFGRSRKRPTLYLDDKMSATAIIASKMSKYIRVPRDKIAPFMTLAVNIDAYDMWRHETHPEKFKVGYNLNTLFWKYGFSSFFNKFKMGFTGFDVIDNTYIAEHEDLKKASFEASIMSPFNGTSLFVLGAESKYVNDYALTFHDYDIFYIVYMYNNCPRVGLRTTRKDIKMGHVVRAIGDNYGCITSAGGHPQAAGIDFMEDTSVDMISLIVEEIDEILQGKRIIDLPF